MTNDSKRRHAFFGSDFHPPGLFDDQADEHPSDGAAGQLAAYDVWVPSDRRVLSKLSQHEIEERLHEIISVEGPMLVERLFRLADSMWKTGKVSKKSLPRLEVALDCLLSRGGVRGEVFPGVRVVHLPLQPARQVRTLGPRAFEEVPATELAEAMMMSGLGVADRRALYAETLNIYGLSVMTKPIERLLNRAYKLIH